MYRLNGQIDANRFPQLKLTSMLDIAGKNENQIGLLGKRSTSLVITCVFVGTVLAAGWALIAPRKWAASQSLVVRDDLLGESLKPGRFGSQESLKSAQETIFHIARKKEVIREAILSLEGSGSKEISDSQLEDFQKSISVHAPNGAEFGKTEVFVLNVLHQSPRQAVEFAQALTDQIENHLRQLRHSLLISMESELASGLVRSEAQLRTLSDEVREMEESVGTDLQTLRSLVDQFGGSSSLQSTLEQIKLEIRQATSDLDNIRKQEQLVLLAMADASSSHIPTSNELLELQPALKRLNEGLIDSRLNLSRAMGSFDEGHPSITTARASVDGAMRQIRNEMESTRIGLGSQAELYETKLRRLQEAEKDYSRRLSEIARMHVTYKSLSDELTKRQELMAKTKADLAEIQSLSASCNDVTLISMVGETQAATQYEGMSRRAMVLAGAFGGLVIGLGLLLLINGPYPGNEPWSLTGMAQIQKSGRTVEKSGAPSTQSMQESCTANSGLKTTDTGSDKSPRQRAASGSLPFGSRSGPATAQREAITTPPQPNTEKPAKDDVREVRPPTTPEVVFSVPKPAPVERKTSNPSDPVPTSNPRITSAGSRNPADSSAQRPVGNDKEHEVKGLEKTGPNETRSTSRPGMMTESVVRPGQVTGAKELIQKIEESRRLAADPGKPVRKAETGGVASEKEPSADAKDISDTGVNIEATVNLAEAALESLRQQIELFPPSIDVYPTSIQNPKT